VSNTGSYHWASSCRSEVHVHKRNKDAKFSVFNLTSVGKDVHWTVLYRKCWIFWLIRSTPKETRSEMCVACLIPVSFYLGTILGPVILSASDLSKWAWSKGYYWHSKVSFFLWPSHCNWQWRTIRTNSVTNLMTSLFQLSNSFHQY
jgi:hypothetical protein